MESVTLHAYLDIEHPMVAWETAIGRIQSAGQPSPSGFGVSLWMFNRLRDFARQGSTSAALGEFRLEAVRASRYPDRVSRLQGVYFFESRDDAMAAIDRWGLPSKYREFVSAVQFSAESITKVDSEWITWNLQSSGGDGWMDRYWAGEAAGVRPLIEVLAVGQGVILNKQLRIEAYKRVYQDSPESTPLLAAACCAFAVCDLPSVAVTKPGILRTETGLAGRYFIYMGEFDEHQSEIVQAVLACQASGEMPSVVMPADPDTVFRIPDNTSLGFDLTAAGLSEALGAIE